MIGARADRHARRRGQAMVEFLVGLVGLLFLILGLFQISTIVLEDTDSLIGSRGQVGEMLANETSDGSASSGGSAYEAQGDFYSQFAEYVNYDTYAELMDPYALADATYGEAIDGDTTSGMVGYQDARSIGIDSGLMRQVMGDAFKINNEVWMPSWEPLMEEE